MTSILVVDDRPVERDLLSTVLGYAGYEVREAADGEQALDAARGAPPDLIITDIVMPRMDGYTFVHELRSDPLLAPIPVVFCTATYGLEEGRRLAEACGVSELLAKPCEPEEILRVVAAAIGSTPGPELPIDAQFHREHLLVLNNKLVQQVEELEEAHRQVVAASRLKSEFVSNMNHEIRTPLNGVIGVAELLIDTELSAEQLKYAHSIRSREPICSRLRITFSTSPGSRPEGSSSRRPHSRYASWSTTRLRSSPGRPTRRASRCGSLWTRGCRRPFMATPPASIRCSRT